MTLGLPVSYSKLYAIWQSTAPSIIEFIKSILKDALDLAQNPPGPVTPQGCLGQKHPLYYKPSNLH